MLKALLPLAVITIGLMIYAWRTLGRPEKERSTGPVYKVSTCAKVSPPLCLCLAFLTLVIGLSHTNAVDRRLGLRRIPWRTEQNQHQLKAIAQALRSYNRLHGHYPINDEGLAPVQLMLKDNAHIVWNKAHQSTGKLVLAVWGEPFIYENRRGLDPSSFSSSHVQNDRKHIYSIEVDKHIYVWSLGAELAQRRYEYYCPRLEALTALTLGIAAFFVLLYLASTIKLIIITGRSGANVSFGGFVSWLLLRDGLLSIFAAAIFLPVVAGPTCYEGSSFTRRTPELTNDYLALIQKYHERGIIGDKAYSKIADAAKHDAF